MVSRQVADSMKLYTPGFSKRNIPALLLESLAPSKMKKKGVMGKNKAQAEAQNQLGKQKAASRRVADKNLEELIKEGESATVDNDDDWVDFEQLEL